MTIGWQERVASEREPRASSWIKLRAVKNGILSPKLN